MVGVIRLDPNAVESEALEYVAEDELGLESYYDDGRVIEVGDAATKKELEEKLYTESREYGRRNDHQAAQWYSDAARKVSDAELQHRPPRDGGASA